MLLFVSREILDESKPNFGEVKKAPSETYDPRPLYQRLAENKRKEEDEQLEKNKLSNFIYQMNNDEYDFLNNVKEEENLKYKRLKEEEKKEVEQFKKDVELSSLKTPYLDSLLKETSNDNKNKEKIDKPKVQSIQKSLLQNIIVKKKRGRDNQEKKENKENNKKVKILENKSKEEIKTEKKEQKSALLLLADYSNSDSNSETDTESNDFQ
ncbi:hypothetical protein U3516DRAFT_293771 [Neocallimastix sp. 'constans']